MSSSTNLDYIRFTTRQINLYIGLFLLITGFFGNLFNITIFTTLKTFRQTTCSCYLITASIANITVLVTILLRILYDGLSLGLSYTTLFCKFRFFIPHYGVFISLTSMCFAIIDQFISMTNKFKQWSQLRIAYRLIVFTSVLWFIVSIFAFIYYDVSINLCIITNAIYIKYYTYFQTIVLVGFLPLSIMIIFSVLAFFKIRTIASRQINIVRLSRDRQLTAMTLFHVLFIIISSIPFLTYYVFSFGINTKDQIEIARNQLIYVIINLFYYTDYCWSFYIYCCVSKRFRKQVMYVSIDVHLKRWRRRINNIHNNQITPFPIETGNEYRRQAPTELYEIALY